MAVSEVGKLTKGVQRIAGNARGDAIIAWERSDRAEFVARTAGGPFGKPVALPSDAGDPEVAMNDSGEAVIVWSVGRELAGVLANQPFRIAGSGCSLNVRGVVLAANGTATVVFMDCNQAYYVDIPRGGAPTAPQPIQGVTYGPGVAGAADGTIVAVSADAASVTVSVRPPGGAFTSNTIAVAQSQAVSLDVGRNGGYVVAWEVPGSITAMVNGGAPFTVPGTQLRALAVDDAGAATAVVVDKRDILAVPLGGAPQKIVTGETCRVVADFDTAGALYVVGDTDCGGARIWGAVRPAGGKFSGKARALSPEASNHPPVLAASGAGAVAAWPIGVGPPHNLHLMAVSTFRGVPLVAFTGKPRVRGSRVRVGVRASTPVTARVQVQVRRGKRWRTTATVRRKISGTRTLTVRRPRGTARIVITVPGGDVVSRRI